MKEEGKQVGKYSLKKHCLEDSLVLEEANAAFAKAVDGGVHMLLDVVAALRKLADEAGHKPKLRIDTEGCFSACCQWDRATKLRYAEVAVDTAALYAAVAEIQMAIAEKTMMARLRRCCHACSSRLGHRKLED